MVIILDSIRGARNGQPPSKPIAVLTKGFYTTLNTQTLHHALIDVTDTSWEYDTL